MEELRGIAQRLESAVAARGWEQPATLWLEADGEWVLERVVLGHPADVLIGERYDEAAACALVTEGWTYSPVRLRQLQRGRELSKPSSYRDSLEVRHVFVSCRDGVEIVANRVRGQELEILPVGGEIEVQGRLIETVRRVLGSPSGARVDASVPQVRERAVLSLVFSAVSQIVAINGEAGTALAMCHRSADSLLAAVRSLGLGASSWDDAIALARAHDGHDELTRRFLHWADGPMWGNRTEDMFPLAHAVRDSLEMLAVEHRAALDSLLSDLGVQ
jgi:hypothetical protein